MSPPGTRLGPVEQIPLGEGRAFLVGVEPVAVFRPRSGGLHALRALCPHRGGPLADGLVDGQVVVCPLHHHRFALADGSCTTGTDDVAVYRVYEQDGDLVVDTEVETPGVGLRPAGRRPRDGS